MHLVLTILSKDHDCSETLIFAENMYKVMTLRGRTLTKLGLGLTMVKQNNNNNNKTKNYHTVILYYCLFLYYHRYYISLDLYVIFKALEAFYIDDMITLRNLLKQEIF